MAHDAKTGHGGLHGQGRRPRDLAAPRPAIASGPSHRRRTRHRRTSLRGRVAQVGDRPSTQPPPETDKNDRSTDGSDRHHEKDTPFQLPRVFSGPETGGQERETWDILRQQARSGAKLPAPRTVREADVQSCRHTQKEGRCRAGSQGRFCGRHGRLPRVRVSAARDGAVPD
jgi:hypothetical protein